MTVTLTGSKTTVEPKTGNCVFERDYTKMRYYLPVFFVTYKFNLFLLIGVEQ